MKKANVAIFERNDNYFNELKTYFENSDNFNVCASAQTGDVALETLNSAKPDVAIIDPMLKGVDGIKLLDHIKATYPD